MIQRPETALTSVSANSDQSGSELQGLESTTVEVFGPEKRPVETPLLVAGEGRPVLFLSGLIGTNRHWANVIRLVKDRVRCLALEVPLLELKGDDCGVPGVTAMVGRFVRETLDQPPIYVGSSFGGHVSLKLALEQPELVAGLVLAGSSGLAEKPLLGSDRTPRNDREWLTDRVAELFYDRAKMDPRDVDRAWDELGNRRKARAMIKLSRSARTDHLGSVLHRIKAPTLVLWGREDIVTPPEAAREFAAKIPDARMHWIEQCGHAPMVEEPEAFAEALMAFTMEVDARPLDA